MSFLADTSAWTNRTKDPDLARWFDALVEDDEIATCDMVRMELLHSARDHQEFVEMREDLSYLENVPVDESVWTRAIDVFGKLAAKGPLHHRQVKLPDLVIAAAAEGAGFEVLHYDRDFDVIASVTAQPVRAVAPLGSL